MNMTYSLFGALGSLVLAQASGAVPDGAKGWLEGGAYFGFVAFLTFAVSTLWKTNQTLGEKLGTLEKEFREEWKGLVEKLTKALEDANEGK